MFEGHIVTLSLDHQIENQKNLAASIMYLIYKQHQDMESRLSNNNV